MTNVKSPLLKLHKFTVCGSVNRKMTLFDISYYLFLNMGHNSVNKVDQLNNW